MIEKFKKLQDLCWNFQVTQRLRVIIRDYMCDNLKQEQRQKSEKSAVI